VKLAGNHNTACQTQRASARCGWLKTANAAKVAQKKTRSTSSLEACPTGPDETVLAQANTAADTVRKTKFKIKHEN